MPNQIDQACGIRAVEDRYVHNGSPSAPGSRSEVLAHLDHADQMAAEVYATRCARRIAAVRALKIEGK
jgi:hypothetical protein